MVIKSELAGMSPASVRRALAGLPRTGYEVVVKPLRYRTGPHLAALCEWMATHSFGADILLVRALHPGLLTLESWLSENGWAQLAAEPIASAAAPA